MSTASDNPSPAEAEAEAEQARAGLVNTLQQLRENLKPANMVDEVMTSAKAGASVLTDQVWDTARRKPLPALMIGAGLAMIFGLGARSAVARPEAPEPRPRGEQAIDPALRSQMGRPPVPPRPDTIGAQAAGAVDKVSRQAGSLLDAANQHLSEAARRGARTVNDTLRTAKGQDTMTSLNRSRDQLSHSLTRLIEEQPLVLAALGVAVGAAIGAAIPTTERENSLMGETSHSVRDAATTLAQQQYEQVKAAATHAVDDIKQTAADHGVTTDNLSGLMQDVGAKAKAAAYEAGRSVNPES